MPAHQGHFTGPGRSNARICVAAAATCTPRHADTSPHNQQNTRKTPTSVIRQTEHASRHRVLTTRHDEAKAETDCRPCLACACAGRERHMRTHSRHHDDPSQSTTRSRSDAWAVRVRRQYSPSGLGVSRRGITQARCDRTVGKPAVLYTQWPKAYAGRLRTCNHLWLVLSA